MPRSCCAARIDMPRSYLFAHPEDELDELTRNALSDLLERRVGGEPMAYIMGMKEFWSHELFVSPATLVPRPETELLVELALREIPRKAEWEVLDLGTGSGAIAIAIAGERPLCQVTAVDVSEDALAVARENVRHAVAGQHNARAWQLDGAGCRADNSISSFPTRPMFAATTRRSATCGTSRSLLLPLGTTASTPFVRWLPTARRYSRGDGMLLLEHGADQAV